MGKEMIGRRLAFDTVFETDHLSSYYLPSL